jgi:hypothetical protein
VRRLSSTIQNAGKKLRRQTVITALVATVIFAAGAITVLSRQSAETRRELQMADKSKVVNSKLAHQDPHLTDDSGRQDLTAEDAQKLGAGLKELVNQSTEGLVETKHADGSVSVDLDGRFQNVTVARINKDGSLEQSCVDNAQAAGAFFGIDPKLIDNTSESGTTKQPKVNPTKTRN